ncbi:hypothetical protein R3P38DRAFT_1329349 [Favolaschia claudopus]|uniref:Uncharacterized protein n=1 Tax=Favolaschia claudopus TaxID=2862362 RepID=A0AAW0AUM6_9AGAR
MFYVHSSLSLIASSIPAYYRTSVYSAPILILHVVIWVSRMSRPSLLSRLIRLLAPSTYHTVSRYPPFFLPLYLVPLPLSSQYTKLALPSFLSESGIVVSIKPPPTCLDIPRRLNSTLGRPRHHFQQRSASRLKDSRSEWGSSGTSASTSATPSPPHPRRLPCRQYATPLGRHPFDYRRYHLFTRIFVQLDGCSSSMSVKEHVAVHPIGIVLRLESKDAGALVS